jgi:prostaglandin-E synthase 1
MHRVVHNDLENIPMFILIGLVAILAGVGPTLLMVCSVGFVLTRLAHTLFYVGKKSAPRTASYALGVLFTLTLAFGSIVPLLWK